MRFLRLGLICTAIFSAVLAPMPASADPPVTATVPDKALQTLLREILKRKAIEKEAIETGSGLQYKVLYTGNGRKPRAKGNVTVHYRGLLLNGAQFDSSYDSDEPIKLNLKRVIKGWTEGLQLMPGGSVYVFLIPPELAYGEKGSGAIPPNATLIFEIELFEAK